MPSTQGKPPGLDKGGEGRAGSGLDGSCPDRALPRQPPGLLGTHCATLSQIPVPLFPRTVIMYLCH